MSALEDVLSRLDGVRPSGDGYVARCPVHEDRHASLSVAGGQDRAVVFNCHACRAASDDIVIALGLEPRDILGARRNGDIVPFRNGRTETPLAAITNRVIYDVQGYEHVRLEYQDGTKKFVWRHDGRNGLPEGVRGEDLLYGAEGLAELPDGATVALCEGEQAADAVRASGVNAVATVTGAAGTPSESALRQLLRFDVVLWPDKDAPGLGHMQRAAERLLGLGNTPRWVTWEDAPAKGDAADAAPDDRSRLVLEAVVYSPEIVSAGTSHLTLLWRDAVRGAKHRPGLPKTLRIGPRPLVSSGLKTPKVGWNSGRRQSSVNRAGRNNSAVRHGARIRVDDTSGA